MWLFDKRRNIKPYEYPQMSGYVDAIRESFWTHNEYSYTSDIQNWNVEMAPHEKEAAKRAMLAISQIEVAVKDFWGKIWDRMPKHEVKAVGASFSSNEWIHFDAYSHLLERLWFNNEFEKILEVPCIKKRFDYLTSAMSHQSGSNADYTLSLLLFSILIENISLFSQFFIIMSFNKHKNWLKGISNVIESTTKEEVIHMQFWVELINIIKKENPWILDGKEELIKEMVLESLAVEDEIIDWILATGDIDYINKDVVKTFIHDRANTALKAVWMDNIVQLETKEDLLLEGEWFTDELELTKEWDFFDKRIINYTVGSKSFDGDDLFNAYKNRHVQTA